MSRQIVVDIVGDSKGFSKATKEATESAGGFGSALQGVAMGAGFAVFNKAMELVGELTTKVMESAAIFREDQASMAELQNTLKNTIPGWNGNMSAIDEYIHSQARLGFSADQVRESLGKMVGVTHDVAEAQRLEALAQDLARAKHIDLATATQAVMKTDEGSMKILKSLGIEVDKHATREQALAAIYDQVKGSAEAYANTSAGKLEAAQAKNTESWVKIGKIVDRLQSAVLPLVAAAFEKIADAVGPLADWIDAHLVPAFMQLYSAFMQLVGPAIKYIQDHFESIKPVLIALAVVVGIVVGVIVVAIAIVVAVVIGLVAVIVWCATNFGHFRDIIGGVFSAIGTSVHNNIVSIQNTLTNLVGFVASLPGRISAAAAGMWNGLWNSFRAMLNMIVGAWNRLSFTVGGGSFMGQKIPSMTLSVPKLPYFHEGGVVPGAPGADVLAVLKAGETVVPANKKGQGGVTVHVTIGTYVGDASTLSKMLAHELRLRGALA